MFDELLTKVVLAWRKKGVSKRVVRSRVRWIRLFASRCRSRALCVDASLTWAEAGEFARRHARARGTDPMVAQDFARSALLAWSRALAARGHAVPVWRPRTPRDPRVEQACLVWTENGLAQSTIDKHRHWAERFLRDCARRGCSAQPELTPDRVDRFARRLARCRGIDHPETRRRAAQALRAWSQALAVCGWDVPAWPMTGPRRRRQHRAPSPLVAQFAQYRREHRGASQATIKREVRVVGKFLSFLRDRGLRLASVELPDIDAFVAELAKRLARGSLRLACGTLRCFFRFAFVTGRLARDLAGGILAPRVVRDERPPRGAPWADVRKVLRTIDRTTRRGKRDYAMLLMMASYGLGAAEVVGLQLDDIDWAGGRLRVRRRKTGQEILLPLLPAVAEVLADYVKNGRTRHTTDRSVFLRRPAPYVGLWSSSKALNQIIKIHAQAAGVSVRLTSHSFRHSHATRQIDQGASPKVIGDILGHRAPASTSVYIRAAFQRLRPLALPVPQ